MSTRQTIPVLPLRGTVIFPGLTAAIAAGRPGTLRAIEAALKGDRLVFAVAQRDNAEELQIIFKFQYVTILILWYENCFNFMQVGAVQIGIYTNKKMKKQRLPLLPV